MQPNMLYLSAELTAKNMFTDFNDKHPDMVCYNSYRSQIRYLNISFAKLGNEE